ncbi:MAG: DUF2330 domain-containing protein [Byssovorax sp.]
MVKRASRVAFALSLSILGAGRTAAASGAWIAGAPMAPVEQRVAVAVGPERTTIWTSLRLSQTSAGAVAIVTPAPAGASLDLSSDAWFEALEVATAPRIFPPAAGDPVCPGAPPASPLLFEIAGHVEHVPSLPVQDVAVLDDAAAVASWAQKAGLVLTPALEGALAAQAPSRFVALLFQAPAGPSITPALRVSVAGAPPLLPLALVRAGSGDALDVSAYLIGEGRAKLSGATPASVPALDLRWDAASGKSDYLAERDGALSSGGPGALLTESAGHDALALSTPIADGKASIDSLLVSFFDRASAYGDASQDPATCALAAATILSSPTPVSRACPAALLGVIEGAEACAEPLLPVGQDPAKLRCGGIADDLAVALSGQAPSATWLSREALQIPAGKAGADWYLSFVPGEGVSPVRFASKVDLSGCQSSSSSSSSSGGIFDDLDGGAGSSSSSSGSASSGSMSSGSGSSGSGSSGGEGSVVTDVYVDPGSCNCSGTSDTAADSSGSGCDGSSDTSTDSSGCDGSSSGDSSGDCGGDSSGSSESCDSGGGSSDASCDGGGSSGDMECSGGGGGGDMECSIFSRGVARGRHPKLSVLAMIAVGLMAPLRRRGRKARDENRARKLSAARA